MTALARRVRHAIFDLDGVLLDSEPLYTEATGRIAARFGKVYDWSVKADCIGRGAIDGARTIVTALALPLTPAELLEERERILISLLAGMGAIPGAEAFTRELARRRVPLAIATSTERWLYAHKAAVHGAWLTIFDAIVCGDDARVGRPKPAPDIFLAAAADLGADPADCVVFEDSPAGVAAALAAGMQVVALPDPAMDRARYAGAHVVAAGFAELGPDALGIETAVAARPAGA